MNVQIFIPCFIDQLYPQTGFNMVKVLEKAGCTVKYNPNQTCCGQAAYNSGFWKEAKTVCNKFLKDFSSSDYIVAPSASCVGFVRNYYPSLFDTSSKHNEVKQLTGRIFELSEFLVKIIKQENFGAVFPHKITYHDSCAALRECKIKAEPRKLLAHVQGLQLIEMNDTDTCCGFGGTFAAKFDATSTAMGNHKIENALATGAEYIVSTDLSCLMHQQGVIDNKGYNIKTIHLADVLASGY